MVCAIESGTGPCRNNVPSQLNIWSGVPALITGLKSRCVFEPIAPYTASSLKFTRDRLVVVLKIANSGPFRFVFAIGLTGGKKLNTVGGKKTFCDIWLLSYGNPCPSVCTWNARAM